MAKQKFYSLRNILAKKAVYNMIFGERSSGKTYAVFKYGIKKYYETGEQMAILRRFREDFTGKRGTVLFDALVLNDEITKITGGLWSGVYYFGSKWYLCTYDDKGNRYQDDVPFAYGFALSAMEHDKSTSYPRITTVMFDEFLARNGYLADEFVLFMNTLSTIIRHRNNVTIFMLGNTVNRYCPYFAEMGLRHIKQMKPGDIDVYKYGDSALTVAVEYTAHNKTGKESDYYFAFDNPKLQMITGGAWEVDIYPHCPVKYKPKDILFTYFIMFNGDLLQCEVVQFKFGLFTYIHRKTTQLQAPNKDLIYSTEYMPGANWNRNITKPRTDTEKRIAEFFVKDKVFYQDNEVGEIVRNYLLWCTKKN